MFLKGNPFNPNSTRSPTRRCCAFMEVQTRMIYAQNCPPSALPKSNSKADTILVATMACWLIESWRSKSARTTSISKSPALTVWPPENNPTISAPSTPSAINGDRIYWYYGTQSAKVNIIVLCVDLCHCDRVRLVHASLEFLCSLLRGNFCARKIQKCTARNQTDNDEPDQSKLHCVTRRGGFSINGSPENGEPPNPQSGGDHSHY